MLITFPFVCSENKQRLTA